MTRVLAAFNKLKVKKIPRFTRQLGCITSPPKPNCLPPPLPDAKGCLMGEWPSVILFGSPKLQNYRFTDFLSHLIHDFTFLGSYKKQILARIHLPPKVVHKVAICMKICKSAFQQYTFCTIADQAKFSNWVLFSRIR